MKWTLVVPGALVPATLAPELMRAVRAPRLVQRLASARPGAEHAAGERSVGAAHWSWLAREFGLGSDPPVMAPYAWQAGEAPEQEPQGRWVALCDPVHMAVARDGITLTDLGQDPLLAEEALALLALAREVLTGGAGGCTLGAGLRLEARGKQWFLLADQGLDLQTAPLDSVLGGPVHERMPAGADARQWRILLNEIQMLWHECGVNAAREQRGAKPVNALWIHGAGRWQRLAARTPAQLQVESESLEDTVLRGWMQAAAIGDASPARRPGPSPAGDVLSVCRALFPPFAFQAWGSWLERIGVLEERIEQDLAQARKRGAARFELVLCGTRYARSLALALETPWWRWPRSAPRAPARLLHRWLAEGDALAARQADRP